MSVAEVGMNDRVRMVSTGDEAVLSTEVTPSLSGVWIDRDLSWLDFNERVLAEAWDERTPLLERVKFLAIFTSNLDEFFMKRMAILRYRESEERNSLVRRIREKLTPMLARQAECYRQTIVPGLAARGIRLQTWEELRPSQQDEACRYFESNLSPALTPLVVDPVHPFPFLSNLSTSLIFLLRDPCRNESIYA